MRSEPNRAYWVLRPGVGELRRVPPSDSLAAGHSRVRALFTGVSVGTERLVGLGRVPAPCREAMACRYMDGGFELPIKYGYSYVGEALDGALAGERIFVMHPHQELATIADDHALPLPSTLPAARATLIPNLETALNAVWDAEIEPGEEVLVVGGGAVGLLVAYVLHRLHGVRPSVVETDSRRASLGAGLSWVREVLEPDELERGRMSVVFHTSGTEAGLRLAIDALGFEGRVVELSWYGDREVRLELGSHFHYERKRILASQVGSIARPMRGQVDYAGRLAEVVRLLEEEQLDRLLGDPVSFGEMPAYMPRVYSGQVTSPTPLIEYTRSR